MPRSAWMIACAFTLILSACTPDPTMQQRFAEHMTIALANDVPGIDPHLYGAEEVGVIARQLYDTLVYRDPETGAFVPGLATEWAISEDGLTVAFRLRQGVVFHDGTRFDVNAVVANLERITQLGAESRRARSLLGPLSNYQVVDDYTLRLIYSEPYAAVLDAFSQPYLGIASPVALQRYSQVRYQYHQAGTGPFILQEYLPGQYVELRRNDSYNWGPDFYQRPADRALNQLVFRFQEDPAERLRGLEDNTAQLVIGLRPDDARTLVGNAAVQLVPVTIPGQPLFFFMNTQQFPTDSEPFRQALLYATNRSVIADAVYQGFSPVAWGPLSIATDFYFPNVVNSYQYNINRALELLRQNGFQDSDNDGALDFNGVPVELRMIVPPDLLVPEVAQQLNEQWQTLGVRVTQQPVPGRAALIAAAQESDYNLLAYDRPALDPSILNESFLSNSGANYARVGDQNLDRALLEASRSFDPQVRQSLYAEAQAIIMNRALILPIRDNVTINAHRITVQNLVFSAYGWYPLLHNVRYIN